jgi:cell division protein FtsQ
VFEANLGEIEQDMLPRLNGPDGQAADVWAMYRQINGLFSEMDLTIEALELSKGGSWRVFLDTGAVVELGRGNAAEVMARVTRFLETLTQVVSRYGRKPAAVESADLRHDNGYAIRMQGVTTVVPVVPKK